MAAFQPATSIEGAVLRACLSLTATSPYWRFTGQKAHLGSRAIRPCEGGYATGCAYEIYQDPVELIRQLEADYQDYEDAVAEDREAAYEAAVERGDFDVDADDMSDFDFHETD